MKKILQLSECSNLKVLAICTLLMGVFMAIILPYEARLYADISHQLSSPDTQLFYTSDWLYQLARDLGEEGRRFYIISRLRFDILWPLVFTGFFFVLISLLYKHVTGKKYYLLIPLMGLVFDYLENLFVSIVFAFYPIELTSIAVLAGIFTLMKWTMITMTTALIVIGLGLFIIKTMLNKKEDIDD